MRIYYRPDPVTLFGGGSPGISFTKCCRTWRPASHCGIVWTDGEGEAFDAYCVSLGSLFSSYAGGVVDGMTAEDRFYGATNSGGISRIYISNSIGVSKSSICNTACAALLKMLPPSSLALLGIGLAAIMLRRKT